MIHKATIKAENRSTFCFIANILRSKHTCQIRIVFLVSLDWMLRSSCKFSPTRKTSSSSCCLLLILKLSVCFQDKVYPPLILRITTNSHEHEERQLVERNPDDHKIIPLNSVMSCFVPWLSMHYLITFYKKKKALLSFLQKLTQKLIFSTSIYIRSI